VHALLGQFKAILMRRRTFLESGSAAMLAAPLVASSLSHAAWDESERIVVGVMGMSRGRDLAQEAMKLPGVVLKYVCDTDMGRAESAAKGVADAGGNAMPIQDFRRMLDDPELDALFCAAPNHWHGPATILACKAGKHVYVEKPASHNPQEGEWMIAAAEKYRRCVQVGTQRRSSLGYQNAIQKLHSGAIGKVYLARAFYNSRRGSIGVKSDSAPPPALDYDLWQGPAPKRPFRENVVHYHWHWFWHWGNGELGNNGIHLLDICRWGLQVEYPVRTVSSGGRYCFDDDQETPDTHTVAWEFEGGKQITYEGLSCVPRSNGPFVSFYGSDGYLEIDGDGGYKFFDGKNREVESADATGWGQREHVANFIDAVRNDDPSRLNQPIASGHRSTLLCHLGNIAHRVDRVLHSHASDGRVVGDLPDGLWQREYDPAWEKQVSET